MVRTVAEYLGTGAVPVMHWHRSPTYRSRRRSGRPHCIASPNTNSSKVAGFWLWACGTGADGGYTCIVMDADGAMVSEVVAEPEPVPLACGAIASVFVNGFEAV